VAAHALQRVEVRVVVEASNGRWRASAGQRRFDPSSEASSVRGGARPVASNPQARGQRLLPFSLHTRQPTPSSRTRSCPGRSKVRSSARVMTGSVGWSQGDWYSDGEDQIHFFPFPKRLVWTSGKKIVAQIEAWGGVRPQRGIRYKTMKPHPTTPGGYVISGWGRICPTGGRFREFVGELRCGSIRAALTYCTEPTSWVVGAGSMPKFHT
jgi:hypothetical protein